ncbi:MAG: hypothetical protein JXA09_00070 [Anaerolineae bacterium]|nr:hypothetical protein [Anaerolineae bacterium]
MPEPGPSSRPVTWRVALALVVGLALAARLLPGERTIDDAYITFRYARNLSAGLGLVYNSGERVLGTTTPLYALLMAGEGLLIDSTDYPALALVTNAVADAATTLLLALLCRRALGAPWLGIACSALWAVSPMSVTFAIGGMETSIYVLLLTATLYVYAAGRTAWSAALCALATLTRPDALILAAPLFLHMLWHERRIPWRAGAVYLLAIAPWALFATLTYGSPLPHTIAAKTVAYRLDRFSALVRLIQHYATPFFEDEILGVRWIAVGAVLYLALSWIGAYAMVRRKRRMLPLALYPWIYAIVFSVRNPLVFRWYLAPMLPMYVLSILYGARQIGLDLVAAVQGRWPRAARVAWVTGAALSTVAMAFLVNGWTLHPDHGPDRPAPKMAWFKLEQLYRQATLDLVARREVTPETRIAAADIGAVGYYSGARILDTLGLVSPGSTTYYPLPAEAHAITYAVPVQLVLDEAPDYAILLEVYARYTLETSPAFAATYARDRVWPTDIFGSEGMIVYRRTSP